MIPAIPRDEVGAGDIAPVAERLGFLSETPEMAERWEGHLGFSFDGWDDDPRESAEIPAIRDMEPELQALRIVPFGLEEGETVRSRFFGSSVRCEDQVGDLPEAWFDKALEEIQTNLPAEGRKRGGVVPARRQASVSEVATLELTAMPVAEDEEPWQEAFNTRGGTSE